MPWKVYCSIYHVSLMYAHTIGELLALKRVRKKGLVSGQQLESS